MTRRIIQLLLALTAGLLTNVAFAPFGYAPIAVLTLALLFRLWDSTARQAIWLGLAFGLGFYGVGVNWIYISVHEFGLASPLLATAALVLLATLMSFFVALAGYLQAKFRTSPGWHYLVLLPALWTLTEWLRGWLFSGFPWLYLGYSQTDTWLVGWAPLTGVLGTSFIVCILAGALAGLSRGIRLVPLGVALLVIGSGWLGSRIDWTDQHFAPLRVTVIQGDVSVLHKWDRRYAVRLLDYFVTQSQAIEAADLIVWPEIALPYSDLHLEKLRLWDRLKRHPADFLVGTLEQQQHEEVTRYYNSAYGIAGDRIQKYRKSQLVPFGEYTPFRRALNWLHEFVNLPASDMMAFTAPQPPLVLAGHAAGVTICYEDAFPREVVKTLPAATYLINISEDAWFGDRLAPHQRLQMSRMRAIETARPVVRAANRGISASIDHQGQVIDRLNQTDGKVLSTMVTPTGGVTPFVRYGSTPLVLLCAALLGMSVIQRHRRRTN